MSEPPVDNAQLRGLLYRHSLASQRFRETAARSMGLYGTECMAISYLALGEPITSSELAHRLELSSGGISALMQRLEHQDLIRRYPHPRDRRSRFVVLTDTATEQLGEVYRSLVAELDARVAQLDDEQAVVVVAFLQDVTDATIRATEGMQRPKDRGHGQQGFSNPVPGLWA